MRVGGGGLGFGAAPVTNARGNLHGLEAVSAASEPARTNRVLALVGIGLDGEWDLSPEAVVEGLG